MLSQLGTLRELAPPQPSHRWAIGGAGAGDTLAGATAVGDVVALAAGSRLEVHSRSGAWPPMALELGAAVGCSIGLNTPVAVRPGGEHVACVLGMGKVVTCRALPSGAEAFALDRSHLGGSVQGLSSNPRGYQLLACSRFCTALFATPRAPLSVQSDDGLRGWPAAAPADAVRPAPARPQVP